MKAWHFTGATLRDGRPIPPVGEWLIHEGEAEMCVSGLHASVRILDALNYAPGTAIHRVECDDIVEQQGDKLLCRCRKITASLTEEQGEKILREFARYCARSVLHLWEAPDVVKRYLRTGDESLRAAAWAAAWDAARAAAWDAARAAAWDAARAAAGDAAWDAARAAAWDAAWDAAGDAA
jgi:hypothetical protein